jgi:hypothetical protein
MVSIFPRGRRMPKSITKTVFLEIEKLLKLGGHSHIEIAATVGVESSLVSTIARGRHDYQLYSAPISSRPKYLPTPGEIEAECAKLRAARKKGEVDEPKPVNSEGRLPPGITFGTLD